MIIRSIGRVKARDNLKLLYLPYHSIYGHKTWQDDDLTFTDFYPYNHVVL